MKAKVILFKESGKYYTEEEWIVPDGAIGPFDMERSPSFRRIGDGAVLVVTQEPWGYPHLFPSSTGSFWPSVDTEIEPVEPAPEWIPAEWEYVLTGDHVRIGQQEADVADSNVGMWHVDNTDEYRPKRWDHKTVTIKLTHLTGRLTFPPGGPVEILMNRERQAVFLLQTQLDATSVQK